MLFRSIRGFLVPSSSHAGRRQIGPESSATALRPCASLPVEGRVELGMGRFISMVLLCWALPATLLAFLLRRKLGSWRPDTFAGACTLTRRTPRQCTAGAAVPKPRRVAGGGVQGNGLCHATGRFHAPPGPEAWSRATAIISMNDSFGGRVPQDPRCGTHDLFHAEARGARPSDRRLAELAPPIGSDARFMVPIPV